ncbi:MAG: NAD+ synthase [Actinobacteria bacterium]|nr:NAD+ synthase [Actinomycetota bacterium]MCL5882760.1 NAD+ synthase [Actinomycetota bacterium]
MDRIRLALAQINSIVGDLDGNAAKIAGYIERAKSSGADIVVFPELSLTGYPPEDLTFNPDFLDANTAALEGLCGKAIGIVVIIGYLDSPGGDVYNAAAVLSGGKVAGICHKMRLPNYGVFDEFRYFSSASRPALFDLNGTLVAVNICEDIWYPDEPIGSQVAAGASLIVNLSASPYRTGRTRTREEMLETRARDYLTPVALVNLVGGQDELVFDGNSLVYDEHGHLIARGVSFQEDLIVCDIDLVEVHNSRHRDVMGRLEDLSRRHPGPVDIFAVGEAQAASTVRGHLEPHLPEPLSGDAEIYSALVMGVHDYVGKNGFKRVLVGLSGGVDSALVAAVAVDALGKENVVCVSMPSRYTSDGTLSDAERLAQRLGVEFRNIPIEPVFTMFLETLASEFGRSGPDTTEENLQARIRGDLLMALSNKFGWLVLTTGNKSELSVGYATLYGDMAGGFAVIKDVPKTVVYRLCLWRNLQAGGEVIPESIISREPSAELAPDQKDSDSLPPYDLLDRIIEDYVEHDKSLEEMIAAGFDEATVRRITRMIDRNEYKRRQAPPGIKITSRAFGKDRRFPITNRFWPGPRS